MALNHSQRRCHLIMAVNIDINYFEQVVGQFYPTELQFINTNSLDTEAPHLDKLIVL